MNQKLKKVLLAGVIAVCIAGGSMTLASKGAPRKEVSNDQYVRGWIDNSWNTFTIPKNPNFIIEPTMLLIKQKRERDTILRIANLSYTGEGSMDSSVLSMRTITNCEVTQ